MSPLLPQLQSLAKANEVIDKHFLKQDHQEAHQNHYCECQHSQHSAVHDVCSEVKPFRCSLGQHKHENGVHECQNDKGRQRFGLKEHSLFERLGLYGGDCCEYLEEVHRYEQQCVAVALAIVPFNTVDVYRLALKLNEIAVQPQKVDCHNRSSTQENLAEHGHDILSRHQAFIHHQRT